MSKLHRPNLVSHAGLVPVMRLAQRADVKGLVKQHVGVDHECGANLHHKIASIVAGMAAGADSIDDLDVIRAGGMHRLFDGLRAPSTLGSFRRATRWGHVRQIETVHRTVLSRLAADAPLLPGADAVAYVDVDSTLKRVFGHTKHSLPGLHLRPAPLSFGRRTRSVGWRTGATCDTAPPHPAVPAESGS